MEKIAIVRTGGKQYVVKSGQKLRVEKLDAKEGDTVTLSDVLLTAEGDKVEVGQPTVAGASVKAKVMRQGKADKVMVVKFKAKVRYKRTRGHRQQVTDLLIEKV